ncbi:hypothetical protein OB13_01690 [Pontibacter sp. HJ8]
MKRTLRIVFTLAVISLTGCTNDFYPAVDERLTAIPVQPHNKAVEVFFAGEWPKEEYVKIAALEARGGEATPYITLINRLKASARAHGADALVVQEKSYITDVYSNSDRMVATSGTTALNGVAIKYKKNLDLGLMPKQQQIDRYDPVSDTFEPVLNLQLGIDGEITAKEESRADAMNIYNVYLHDYTERHLLKEQSAGWTERRQEGFVTERRLHSEKGMLLKYLRFQYNMQRQLQQVIIEKSGRQTEEVRYTYNDAGKLTSRSIDRDKMPYLQEDYTYDANGKVSEVQLSLNTREGMKPLLRSTFAYYTLEEIL